MELEKLNVQPDDILVLYVDEATTTYGRVSETMRGLHEIVDNTLVALPKDMNLTAERIDNIIEMLLERKRVMFDGE